MDGMTSFGAVARSFRVAEIRLEEVVRQVGDAQQFIVRVLDHGGAERQFELDFTQKWSGVWCRQLRCPLCCRAARVLSVQGQSAVCGRCRPRRTAHHKYKNSSQWHAEGALADTFSRALLRGNSSRAPSSMKQLTEHLTERSTARTAAAIDSAARLIQAVDHSGMLLLQADEDAR